MDVKVVVAICACAMFIGCATEKNSARKYTPMEYFKNYALCTCIADGFQSEEVVKDAAAGARGYLEFGDLSLEAHTDAVKLGRQFLGKEYKSKTGGNLVMMKCVDFYHSKELDTLANRHVQVD